METKGGAAVIEMLNLKHLQIDPEIQQRAALNSQVVDDYAHALGEGAEFPPIVVFHDGEAYWLADGFHRHKAAKQIGVERLSADLRNGKRRDALLYATGANADHGLRRTSADKRRAVETLLKDSDWGKWSDREIARRCKVGHPLVAELRKSLTGISSSEERTYRTKHGTEATMKPRKSRSKPSVDSKPGSAGFVVPSGQESVKTGGSPLVVTETGKNKRTVDIVDEPELTDEERAFRSKDGAERISNIVGNNTIDEPELTEFERMAQAWITFLASGSEESRAEFLAGLGVKQVEPYLNPQHTAYQRVLEGILWLKARNFGDGTFGARDIKILTDLTDGNRVGVELNKLVKQGRLENGGGDKPAGKLEMRVNTVNAALATSDAAE